MDEPEPRIGDVVYVDGRRTTVDRLCEDSGTWLSNGQTVCASQLRHLTGRTWELVRPVTHAERQARILADIKRERDAQDARFGVQDLPHGTGGVRLRRLADTHRDECDYAFDHGEGTFRHVLMEEVYEAMAETHPATLRAELIQAGAVIVKFIEAIDRAGEST
ncbi:hypothetical protein [Streptomyces niveus]|uniref:hypothetical protein n=1 Tax=Streptomyces niveus TaxID=193462 RepID=UPI00365DC43A